MFQTSATGNYLFTNNSWIAPLNSISSGITFGQSGNAVNSFNSIVISNNSFIGIGSSINGAPIGGFGFQGTGRLNLDNNLFGNVGAGNNVIIQSTVLFDLQAGADLTLNISNNVWENSQDETLASLNVMNEDPSSKACIVLHNNSSDVLIGNTAYALDNTAGGTMITDVKGNIGTVTETNTTPGACP